MQKATFHAATDFKGMTVGLSGSVANPAALNYVFAPNKNTILETDLKNYTLHLYNKVIILFGIIKLDLILNFEIYFINFSGWRLHCYCR